MATLSLHLPAASSEAAGPARKPGFWRRAYEALMAARLRQAEIEVHRYRNVIPHDPVAEAGCRVGLRDMGALPFVR